MTNSRCSLGGVLSRTKTRFSVLVSAVVLVKLSAVVLDKLSAVVLVSAVVLG